MVAAPAPGRTDGRRRAAAIMALAACLSGCGAKPANDAAPAAVSPPRAGLTLDESRLPPLMHFSTADLDTTKDPCVDFNGYVNAKWMAATQIPADRSSWGPPNAMAERAGAVLRQLAEQVAAKPDATGIDKIVGDFWATGMDEAAVNAAGLTPLQSRLAEIDALDGPAAIAGYLRTTAARGESFVFGVVPLVDFKDSRVYTAVAMQSGLGLDDRGYYFDADKRDKLEAYQTYLARLLQLSGLSGVAAAAQAREVIGFETRLAKVSKSKLEIARDRSLLYNPITPAAADALTPDFPWTTFFEAQGIAAPATFSLAIPAFHQEVSRMLRAVPPEQWRAYFRAHLLDSAAPFLSEPFVQAAYDFHARTMQGQPQMAPRWKRVLAATEESAGEALGQLYVQVAFPAASKARMEGLVRDLNTALKARLERLEWMSDGTRQRALAKAAAFTTKIGYPDKWRDYAGLKTSRESYFSNVLAATAFGHTREMAKIGKAVDKAEWLTTPQTVNAFYNGSANEIIFTAAILQPSWFEPANDAAVNYGSIGAVIGHEMIHGYDDQGSRYGPTGNFEDWWTPADRQAFTARTDRLVEQFNGYEALPGLHVNGKLTLGENIADLGGLATAYDAMQAATAGTPDPKTDGLSRDQRFFIAYGTAWRALYTPDLLKLVIASDGHSPSQFRAVAAPSNLPAFAAAFSCRPGQPMVRSGDRQVVLW